MRATKKEPARSKRTSRFEYSPCRVGTCPTLRLRRLLQQRQHVLRVLVRDLEHHRAGLHEDLCPGEGGGLGREVGVADLALGFGQVDDRVVQGVAVRFQRGALERAESAAE